MNKILNLLIIIFLSSHVHAGVISKDEHTTVDGKTFHNFLAYDDSTAEKRPGVIVVHEWWGLNEYAKYRAKKLAKLGYTAIAVDMYGEGKFATHPKNAKEFATALRQNMPGAKKRFEVAMDVLKNNPTVDANRIAAIGYCLGGSVVLNMARMGVDMKAVVSFHGNLSTSTPAQAGLVKAKILVCHGDLDKKISAQIPDFEKEMQQAGADYKIVIYPNATHSWTNPDASKIGKEYELPVRYNPEADLQSWEDMQEFFKANL